MAEIVTIANRRISGTGLILPTSKQLEYRRYYLYADIIRKPKSPYLNRDSEPPRTYYGVISLTKDNYVYCTHKIEFDSQTWVFDADITGQVINTIKCQYLGVLQSYINLGTALGLTVTTVENAIRDFKNLPLQWDAIKIKCYADSAVQFVLKGLEYDVCNEDDKTPRQPPAPPDKPDPVPPGTPTNVDPPYDSDTTTEPLPIDQLPPPPIEGTWLLTWNTSEGQAVSGTYPGKETDTFVLRSPGRGCSLSGSSELIRLPDETVLDPTFNCNGFGFVSTILSAVFTPGTE